MSSTDERLNRFERKNRSDILKRVGGRGSYQAIFELLMERLDDAKANWLTRITVNNRFLYNLVKSLFPAAPLRQSIEIIDFQRSELATVDARIREDLASLGDYFVEKSSTSNNDLLFRHHFTKVELEKALPFQKSLTYNLHIELQNGGGLVYSYNILLLNRSQVAVWQSWTTPEEAYNQYLEAVS